jgi:hypothetical protein
MERMAFRHGPGFLDSTAEAFRQFDDDLCRLICSCKAEYILIKEFRIASRNILNLNDVCWATLKLISKSGGLIYFHFIEND